MPSGLQVWNASGQLIFDTPDRMIRFFGTVTITSGANTGTINDPKLAQGTPWFAFVASNFGAADPTVTVGSTSLTWTKDPSNPTWSGSILYGVR